MAHGLKRGHKGDRTRAQRIARQAWQVSARRIGPRLTYTQNTKLRDCVHALARPGVVVTVHVPQTKSHHKVVHHKTKTVVVLEWDLEIAHDLDRSNPMLRRRKAALPLGLVCILRLPFLAFGRKLKKKKTLDRHPFRIQMTRSFHTHNHQWSTGMVPSEQLQWDQSQTTREAQ